MVTNARKHDSTWSASAFYEGSSKAGCLESTQYAGNVNRVLKSLLNMEDISRKILLENIGDIFSNLAFKINLERLIYINISSVQKQTDTKNTFEVLPSRSRTVDGRIYFHFHFCFSQNPSLISNNKILFSHLISQQ